VFYENRDRVPIWVEVFGARGDLDLSRERGDEAGIEIRLSRLVRQVAPHPMQLSLNHFNHLSVMTK